MFSAAVGGAGFHSYGKLAKPERIFSVCKAIPIAPFVAAKIKGIITNSNVYQ